MNRLKPGMVVTAYRYFATREGPIGTAELVERIDGGLLARGGQLEHWRVNYVDPPGQADEGDPARPQTVTIRTDEPDLRTGAPPPPDDYGPDVRC